MSGGPVVNIETGDLCGLICSSLPPSLDDPEGFEASYATTLWPVMGTVMKVDGIPGNYFPLLKLAEQGVINAPDWKRVMCTSIRDDGHTVDLQVEFPKIEGSFESCTLEGPDVHRVMFSFSVDGVPQGLFSVMVTQSSSQVSSLNPEFSGPWDGDEFARLVSQYMKAPSDKTKFQMAAQHLGRGSPKQDTPVGPT